MPIGRADGLPQVENQNKAEDNQGYEAITEQQSGNKPPKVITFIGSSLLDSAVDHHGDHEKDQKDPMWTEKTARQKRDQKSDQFSGTASTERELLSPKMKRPVLSTMTAENDRQPFIQKRSHILIHRGKSDNEEHNVQKNCQNNADKSTDTGNFCAFRFITFPNKEQDKPDDGNTKT